MNVSSLKLINPSRLPDVPQDSLSWTISNLWYCTSPTHILLILPNALLAFLIEETYISFQSKSSIAKGSECLQCQVTLNIWIRFECFNNQTPLWHPRHLLLARSLVFTLLSPSLSGYWSFVLSMSAWRCTRTPNQMIARSHRLR